MGSILRSPQDQADQPPGAIGSDALDQLLGLRVLRESDADAGVDHLTPLHFRQTLRPGSNCRWLRRLLHDRHVSIFGMKNARFWVSSLKAFSLAGESIVIMPP